VLFFLCEIGEERKVNQIVEIIELDSLQSEVFHKSELCIALLFICENGASVGSRKVQASVLGRSVRWQNQHHHSLHVRQIRQHLSGFLLSDPIVFSLFLAQSFSIFYKIKRSRFYCGM